MEKFHETLKFKLTAIVLGCLTIGGMLISYVASGNAEEELHKEAAADFKSFSQLLDQKVQSKINEMASQLDGILVNRDVITFFNDGERDSLKTLLLPLFKNSLEARSNIAQFQFHLPPATSFLRLHKTEKFGDDLSGFRQTVVKSNASRSAVAGVEVGRGGVGIRLVVPVFHNQNHIGSVELGGSLEGVVADIAKSMEMDFAIAIRQDVFENARRFTDKEKDFVKGDLVYYNYSSVGVMNLFNGESIADQFAMLENDDKSYGWISKPLIDYSGEQIGYVSVFIDLSDKLSAISTARTRSYLVLFLLVLVIAGVTYFFMQRFLFSRLRDSVQLAKDLENGVFSAEEIENGQDELAELEKSLLHMGIKITMQMNNVRSILNTILKVQTAPTLDSAIQLILEGLQHMLQAQYVALSTFTKSGGIDRFFTLGMSEAAQRSIGGYPKGEGLLKHVYQSRQILRIEDIDKHAASAGFPANHPAMKSLIAGPVMHDEQLFGTVYLTNKTDGQAFTAEDEEVLKFFLPLLSITLKEKKVNAEILETKKYMEAESVQILQAIRRLAKGDLSVNVAVNNRGDDLSRIESGLSEMVASLRTLVGDIYKLAENATSQIEQISSSTEELSAGAKNQSASSQGVASAMEEMNLTVYENSQNAQRTAGLAKQNGDVMVEVNRIVRETIEKIQSVAVIIEKSAGMVEELGESSNKIGGIISVIDEIADQTNLLALNAAIEAARAGDQGRGFAVVADEVRRLAERTSHATGEISEMIGKTQKAAGQVVQIIRNGNDEMQQGLKLSQQASDALQSSVEGANDVQVKMAQIATSSDQQSAALTDISRNVESISNITSESATALSDISQTISDLSRVINQLHSSVQQFKLSKSDLMINSFAENERFN